MTITKMRDFWKKPKVFGMKRIDKVKSCAKVVVNIVGDTTKDLDSKNKKENLH